MRQGIFWLGIAIALLSKFHLSGQTTNCVAPPTGMINWWPGDGNATDFVGGANGVYNQYTTGMVGQAFNVASAVSLAISNRASLNPTNGITIEAWVLVSGGGNGKSFYIVSKDGSTSDRQYILSVGPSGKFRAHIGVPNLVYFDGQTAVQSNTWYHVVMTYDRTALKLYVNGNLDSSATATGPIIVTSQPLRIGGGDSAGYTGLVDEATLYDRALSISEIQAIYQANAAGKCKDPFPPMITSDPLAQTNPAGSSVLFSVETKGTPQLFYQWSLDGAPIMGATAGTLALTNIQARDAGMYSVRVTNVAGAVTSAPANLSVTSTVPIVQTGPSNRNAIGETQVSLSVLAYGTESLSYQWRLYGTNLPGATNPSLDFISVSPTNSGKYSVIITNPIGSVTSRVATLTVRDYPKPSTIVAWGDSTYGQTNVPAGDTNVVALAAGSLQTIFLHKDGTVGDFGSQIASPNTYALIPPLASVSTVNSFILGLGTDGHPISFGVTGLSGASDVPASVTNAVATAIGAPRIALKDDGTVIGWLPAPAIPADIFQMSVVFAALSNLTSVTDVAMRGSHCVALMSNHTVVAFGSNDNGETNVPAGLNNVMAISAGSAHCVALKADGTVVAWGNNVYGQTNVPAGLSGVAAISAGDLHTLALKSNGTVVAWGDNTYGQCNVPSNLTNVVYISAGNKHSAALTKQPGVAIDPSAISIFAGDDIAITASATGYQPLYYQWRHEGTNLAGATSPVLTLTDTPLTAGGRYTCIITNPFGSITSPPSILYVVRHPPVLHVSWPGATSTNGTFPLLIYRLSGHGNIIVQASTNLLYWESIYTNPPQLGYVQYMDSIPLNVPTRFYRVVEE